MEKITYADKEALNEIPSIADKNKCKASDLNQIKNVVNANADAVGDIVVVPTETPTEETKLEIESEDFGGIDGSGTYITNTYSESTASGYSTNYANEHFGGVVLYDNFTGSTSTITLSDNASNYRFIDIMFQGNNGTTDTTRAYDLTKGINLFTANINSGVTNAWLQFETISFSENTLNRGVQGEMAFGSNGFIELVSSSLKITKVIGYK